MHNRKRVINLFPMDMYAWITLLAICVINRTLFKGTYLHNWMINRQIRQPVNLRVNFGLPIYKIPNIWTIATQILPTQVINRPDITYAGTIWRDSLLQLHQYCQTMVRTFEKYHRLWHYSDTMLVLKCQSIANCLRDWSRSGGSYGNNTRVSYCPAPGRPESAARGTSPPDNNSHVFTTKYVQNHHQIERWRLLASIVTSRISP